MNDPVLILSAEYVGEAEVIDGQINVGGVAVPFTGYVSHNLAVKSGRSVGVYVRRRSDDLRVIEIHVASHDGYAQEQLDHENAEGGAA